MLCMCKYGGFIHFHFSMQLALLDLIILPEQLSMMAQNICDLLACCRLGSVINM